MKNLRDQVWNGVFNKMVNGMEENHGYDWDARAPIYDQLGALSPDDFIEQFIDLIDLEITIYATAQ